MHGDRFTDHDETGRRRRANAGPAKFRIADSQAPPSVSVIAPVCNESGALERLDQEIRRVLEGIGPTEIVYVDDGSTDGSLAVLRQLCQAATSGAIRTRVIKLRRNFGQTAALAAAIDLAEGDVIVPLDADGQNNPADILRLVECLDQGFDVVSGWRRRRQDKLVRTLPARIANALLCRASGVRLHDSGCTLKAYRAELLKQLPLRGEMHRFIPHFLTALGARVTELEVDHRPRTTGRSKYGSRRILKVLVDLLVIRYMTRYYHRPMHFFGQFALVLAGATMASVATMLAAKFGWLRLIGVDWQAGLLETPLPAVAACCCVGSTMALLGGVLAETLVRAQPGPAAAKAYVIEQIFDSHEETANRPQVVRAA